MVYLFLADGFEEIEALTQVDYLRRAGIDIQTCGIGGKNYITGSKGISVKVDTLIENVRLDDVQMLILPGGLGGVQGIEESETAMTLLKEAYLAGIRISAICAAPTILARLGMLNGKKCICYPDITPILTEHGGIVTDFAVVEDGQFITAKAAGASEEFSFAIIAALSGNEAAQKVRSAICAR